ncbi:MAG: hypothetical protein LBD23_06040 [Oscillospiraceae bacterium]|jgi:hypothetical protein|nr:hypothetical protein [Oscillospiraceae bacterium]
MKKLTKGTIFIFIVTMITLFTMSITAFGLELIPSEGIIICDYEITPDDEHPHKRPRA